MSPQSMQLRTGHLGFYPADAEPVIVEVARPWFGRRVWRRIRRHK